MAVSVPDIAALKRLDDKAWDETYPWLVGKARATAQHFLSGSHFEIDDVVAETIQKLVRKIHEIKDEKHLAFRTVVIAKNLTYDRLRRGGRTQPLSEDYREQAAESAHTEERLTEILRELSQALTPEELSLLYDRHVLLLKQREIAEKRGLGVKSIGSRLERALKKAEAVIGSSGELPARTRSELPVLRVMLILVSLIG